ncbi:MAG: hypothetical protein V1817_02305 [Candidatus Micrarchaeota archaeon]
MFVASAAGFVFFGLRYQRAVRKNAQEKKDLAVAAACGIAAFAFLTALTALYYAPSLQPAQVLNPEIAAINASTSAIGSRLLDYKLESFSRQITPVSCVGVKEIVYWRELRVYNVTRIDAQGKTSSAYYSTISLSLRNEGSTALTELVVRERIPDAIASDPSEIINFSVAPARVVKGSVVVDWMFNNIGPNETKTVTYTVQNNVSGNIFDGMGAPSVATRIAGQYPSTGPSGAQASAASAAFAFSLQWFYLIPLLVILALVALYFENFYKKGLEGVQ